MTKELRNDILICALVVSLAVHVGAMFWARPKVMTTVAAGAVRTAHRGPMRVAKAAERPDPVKIEILKDVEAAKDAPEVAPMVSVAPVADTDEPPSATEVKLPEPIAPEVISRIVPDETAAPMPLGEREAAAPSEPVRMMSDAVAIANPGAVDRFALSPVSELPAAPVFDAPEVAAAGPVDEPVSRIGAAAKA